MFKKPISHKAAQFTESVIREMTRLAMEHGAINLSQGYPDFPAPDVLKKAAADAIFADVNQYAITWGAKNFRDSLVYKTKKFMAHDEKDAGRIGDLARIMESRPFSKQKTWRLIEVLESKQQVVAVADIAEAGVDVLERTQKPAEAAAATALEEETEGA